MAVLTWQVATEADMVPGAARAYGGAGSVGGDASTAPAPREDGRCRAPECFGRSSARVLDPYVLPRAQFGTHALPTPVPTSAGAGPFVPPDARWAPDPLARSGAGLGARGARLPSSVEYQLPFAFAGVHPNATLFTFTRPPFVLATVRARRGLVPEHDAALEGVSDTFAASVADVTAQGFTLRVFRTDRSGEAWPDIGGRGWTAPLDVDWLAWEPLVRHPPPPTRLWTCAQSLRRGCLSLSLSLWPPPPHQ